MEILSPRERPTNEVNRPSPEKSEPVPQETEAQRIERLLTSGEIKDIDSKESLLSQKEREEMTQQGIAAMRDVLKGIDFTVFASTAMYLHGKKYDIPELQELPGDFDAVVEDEQTLSEVRDRLANVPGTYFENNGTFREFKDGAKVLQGYLLMKSEQGEFVKYPFEFFHASTMASEEVVRHKTNIAGLDVLNLEGLQQQYINNLKFESRVGEATEEFATRLLNPVWKDKLIAALDASTPESPSPFLQAFQEEHDVSAEELRDFYKTVKEYAEATGWDMHGAREIPAELLPKISVALSGHKMKIPKREKNIGEARGLRSMNIDT